MKEVIHSFGYSLDYLRELVAGLSAPESIAEAFAAHDMTVVGPPVEVE